MAFVCPRGKAHPLVCSCVPASLLTVSRSALAYPLLLLLAFSTVTGSAQKRKETPIADPSQDQDAVAVLKQTVMALGGEVVADGMKDSSVTATCTRTSRGTTETNNLRWLTKGEFYRVDRGDGDENGVINGVQSRTVMVNGKEVPVEERSARAYKPFHLPGVTLRQVLKQSNIKIEMLDDESLQGKAAFHVRITDVPATLNSFEPVTEDWWIDKSSYLPIRVSFPTQGLNSLRRSINTTLDYSNYSSDKVSGIKYPGTFKRSYEGSVVSTCTITSFAANQGMRDDMFVRKSGGAQ